MTKHALPAAAQTVRSGITKAMCTPNANFASIAARSNNTSEHDPPMQNDGWCERYKMPHDTAKRRRHTTPWHTFSTVSPSKTLQYPASGGCQIRGRKLSPYGTGQIRLSIADGSVNVE